MSATPKTRCPHAVVIWEPLPNPTGQPWAQKYTREVYPCAMNHRTLRTTIDRQLLHRGGKHRWLT